MSVVVLGANSAEEERSEPALSLQRHDNVLD